MLLRHIAASRRPLPRARSENRAEYRHDEQERERVSEGDEADRQDNERQQQSRQAGHARPEFTHERSRLSENLDLYPELFARPNAAALTP